MYYATPTRKHQIAVFTGDDTSINRPSNLCMLAGFIKRIRSVYNAASAAMGHKSQAVVSSHPKYLHTYLHTYHINHINQRKIAKPHLKD